MDGRTISHIIIVNFKILLITFKSLKGFAPDYISELIKVKKSGRSGLRSQAQKHLILEEPRFRLKTFGDRSFAKAAPVLWNSLPSDIQKCDSVDSFKKALKTNHFGLYFD